MKTYFLLSVFLSSCIIGLAQNDTTNAVLTVSEVNSIWKANSNNFPLKRGFYKSYNEFLTNSPSEQRSFTIKEKNKSQERKDDGIFAVNFDLDEGQEKVGKIWGFCDGNAVYMKGHLLEGKYWKVAYIAPYSFFIHVYQVRTLGGIIAAGAVGTREFCVIDSHGKAVYATENYMKKILGKCPGLAAEYGASPNPRDEEIKKAFLRRANDYFAVHTEVIE